MSSDKTLRSSAMATAKAQLTMVEHALCPLDSRESLQMGRVFETSFAYTDANRNRKKGKVKIGCVEGLSPTDELYLWGILGLALAGREPSSDFYATPYWILRQLGRVTKTKKGSEEFRLFRDSIRRLAGVRYQNDAFYDPLRGEHRSVSFGLLNYSLPIDEQSARAWRFAFDPIFWELVSANRSSLRFDLGLYTDLSPAGRRMYLFLKKQFWRNTVTGGLNLREVAVNVLGFNAELPAKHLKTKLSRVVDELVKMELVGFGLGRECFADCLTKKGVGEYTFELHRGPAMERVTELGTHRPEDSPHYEALVSFGFERPAIVRLLATHKPGLLSQWIDITQAAIERGLIDKTPQAYFTYYTQRGATPPDWWHELKRKERAQEAAQDHAKRAMEGKFFEDRGFDSYIETQAKEAFENVMQGLISDFMKGGKPRHEAEREARQHTVSHFRNKYRQQKDRPFETQ